MGTWISDIPLKYKFWAVNAVAFFTTLLLVLFAMQQEAAGRNASAQRAAAAEGELVQSWPAGSALPARSNLLPLEQAASLGGTAAQALGKGQGWIELSGARQGDTRCSAPGSARPAPASASPCLPRPATCGRSSPTGPAPTPSPCWC